MVVIHPPVRYSQMKGVARRYGTSWSHLGVTSDGDLPQLHAIAQELGIARRHFQTTRRLHYDVRGRQYEHAIELGATAVDTTKEWLRCTASS